MDCSVVLCEKRALFNIMQFPQASESTWAVSLSWRQRISFVKWCNNRRFRTDRRLKTGRAVREWGEPRIYREINEEYRSTVTENAPINKSMPGGSCIRNRTTPMTTWKVNRFYETIKQTNPARVEFSLVTAANITKIFTFDSTNHWVDVVLINLVQSTFSQS